MTPSRHGAALAAVALVIAACAGAAAEGISGGDVAAGAVDGVAVPLQVVEEHAEEEATHTEGAAIQSEDLVGAVDHADEHDGELVIAPEVEVPGVRVVEITMTEFAFAPGSIEVSAGETVEFIVTNSGLVEHELRFSNAHRIEEHIASGHEGHGTEGGHHADADVFVVVAAGETAELTATFPEDTTVLTEMVCLIPGHYEAGMVGAVNYVEG